MKNTLCLTVAIFTLTACGPGADNPSAGKSRWYTQAQVEQGKADFKTHCSSCHGENAEGTADWKKTLPDGAYPPPPLNGTAHAWHHPLSILKQTINAGGVQFGGKMPGFKDKLNNQEIEALIAYFQSFWDDKIYQAWLGRGGTSK